MTRNDIIIAINNDKKYKQYCFRVCNGKDLANDLYQYVMEELLLMDEQRLQSLYSSGDIRMYLTRVIYINANSRTAPFLRQHENIESVDLSLLDFMYNEDIEELENNEYVSIKVKKEIEKEIEECTKIGAYPASVKLLELYSEHKSIKKVSELTKIPYMTVYRHVNALRDKIKNNIK